MNDRAVGFIQNDNIEMVQGLISIIMPVYNTPYNLLSEAVKSVIEQTYRDFELLIIDDGSEQDCSTACNRLAETEDRIRVIHIDNSGASSARNKGIDESRGEYIAFIDSDDTMPVNALRVMIDEIKDVDYVVCGCEHIRRDNVKFHGQENVCKKTIRDKKACIEFLCYMNPPYANIETNAVWGKLYRRKCVESLRFNEKMVMAEDFLFNFFYIMSCLKGKYLDFIGYYYLERGDSLSRKYDPRMVNVVDTIEKLLEEHKNTQLYEPLLSRCVNIAFTILMMIPQERAEDKEKIKHFISKYRNQVLRNPQTKRKVKIAIITSYFGYDITKKIFELNRR